jgi:hypothetical protein
MTGCRLRAGGPADPSQIPLWNKFKTVGQIPKEAATTRSKFSTKAVLLATAIGLSTAASTGSQPAAAQSYLDEYECPIGSVYDPTYGCTLEGDAYQPYDYGYYGYLPYGAYYGGHREFDHGFGHGMGGESRHGFHSRRRWWLRPWGRRWAPLELSS